MVFTVQGVLVEIGPNLLSAVIQIVTLLGVIYAGYRAHQGAVTGTQIQQTQQANGAVIAHVAEVIDPSADVLNITKKGS